MSKFDDYQRMKETAAAFEDFLSAAAVAESEHPDGTITRWIHGNDGQISLVMRANDLLETPLERTNLYRSTLASVLCVGLNRMGVKLLAMVLKDFQKELAETAREAYHEMQEIREIAIELDAEEEPEPGA